MSTILWLRPSVLMIYSLLFYSQMRRTVSFSCTYRSYVKVECHRIRIETQVIHSRRCLETVEYRQVVQQQYSQVTTYQLDGCKEFQVQFQGRDSICFGHTRILLHCASNWSQSQLLLNWF